SLLVPVLGFTEHPHFTSDRYGMIVGILGSLVLAGGLKKLQARFGGEKYLIAGSLVVLACIGTMSVHQTGVWQNSVTLFGYALSKNPEGGPYHIKLQRLLASAYLSQQRFTEALDWYEKILRRLPRDPMAHQNSAAI